MNPVLRWLLFPGVGALLGAAVGAPALVHALDEGTAQVTVRQVLDGPLPSRNVKLRVLASAERGLKQTVTEEDHAPKVSFYLPVTDPGAPDGPTELVYFSSGLEVFDAAEHPDRPIEIEGVVRDVLWEGLSSSVKADLEKLHPVSRTVKLIENDSGLDGLMAYGAPLLGLALGLFFASNRQRQP